MKEIAKGTREISEASSSKSNSLDQVCTDRSCRQLCDSNNKTSLVPRLRLHKRCKVRALVSELPPRTLHAPPQCYKMRKDCTQKDNQGPPLHQLPHWYMSGKGSEAGVASRALIHLVKLLSPGLLTPQSPWAQGKSNANMIHHCTSLVVSGMLCTHFFP